MERAKPIGRAPACYFPAVTVSVRPIVVIMAAIAAGCAPPSLQQLADANRYAADMRVQFTKTGDAANRSVMADTDEASVAFAREADQAASAAEKDSRDLRPILDQLRFSAEIRLLDQFDKQFADYRTLDRNILGLAVENTNLKAQRLSFGPVRGAADMFASSLESAVGAQPSPARALAETAIAAVREIQVLQAPHIAESSDEAMTGLEKEMTDAEQRARRALAALAPMLPPASRGGIAAAGTALDHVVELNRQIIDLSRRNTNVRSLALSLGQKRMMAAACDDTLRALQDALGKHEFSASR